jgi:hypothetical protein
LRLRVHALSSPVKTVATIIGAVTRRDARPAFAEARR